MFLPCLSGYRRVRMVRHSDLDRRAGDLASMLVDPGSRSRLEWQSLWAVALFRGVLVSEYGRYLATELRRSRFWRESARHSCSGWDFCCCGGLPGKAGGLGPVLSSPSRFRSTAGNSCGSFVPVVDGHGRVLGDGRAQYPGLHSLCPKSQRAQMWGQALGLPRGHDGLFLHRRRCDIRIRSSVRRSDMGSGSSYSDGFMSL